MSQEVNIKVICNKITIVTVAFCVESFFWYLSKQALFCDQWCPDRLFFGKQNKSISRYISSFLCFVMNPLSPVVVVVVVVVSIVGLVGSEYR